MESRTLENIEAGAEISIDVPTTIIGTIGRGAKIHVNNVDLVIQATVTSEVHIEINNNLKQVVTQSNHRFIGTVISQPTLKLMIVGNLMENVVIDTHGSVNIDIQGNIAGGTNVETQNGHIHITGVCETASSSTQTLLQSMNGNIKCGNIGAGVQLRCTNGFITCGRVEAGAFIDNVNGSIKCQYVAKGARINCVNGSVKCDDAEEGAAAKMKSVNGRVSVAGQVVSKPNRGYQQTMFVGDMVVVNGRRYTQLTSDEDKEPSCCCVIC